MDANAAEELHQAIDELTKVAIIKAGSNAAAAAHIGSMGSLAGLMATALIFAKKPAWVEVMVGTSTPETCGDHNLLKAASQMVTQEAVIFAALLAAFTMDDLNEEGNLSTSFGPPKLWQTLQAWSRIFPDRRADDFITPGLLGAARDAGRGIENPLDALLAGRITNHNSPDTLN